MSTRAYGLALSILTSTAFSCSGDGDGVPAKKPGKPSSEYEEYAIHVVAKTASGELLVDFPPGLTISAGQPATGSSEASVRLTGPGSKPSIKVESDGGTVISDTEAGSTDLLLMRAVAQCRLDDNDFALALTPPWMPLNGGNDSWFVFKQKLNESTGATTFSTCEELLAMEEVLLCAADRLNEIANAVAPITWPSLNSGLVAYTTLPTGAGAPSYMHDEWVIPPQSTKDKFVVRDLAINVLANLARLDLEQPTGVPPEETCATAWSKSSSYGYYESNVSVIYGNGAPFFDKNLALDIDNRVELAELRLTHNTQTLRAAGRLLRRLIDDSVMADLAGAERQRSRAADPGRGPELYWGRKSDADAPYNSLTHAFRVVFGRWESPRPGTWGAPPSFSSGAAAPVPSGDPACGGYTAMELLTEAMGGGTSARWQDRKVRKPAQQFATQLVDRAGLVIPNQALEASWSAGTFGTVVGAVKKQLVLSQALDAGMSSVNDPAFALRKQSIEAMVDGVNPADLRFALDRSFGAYRLLTGAAENTAGIPAADPAGVALVPSGALEADVASLGGNVLKGGMQRGDVATDIMARVGPAQAASQCFEVLTPVPWGTANMGKVTVFQDAFMIGDTFRRRLSQTGALTAGWSSERLWRLADAGAAELRTWTGPTYGFQAEFDGNLYVRLLGIGPDDLGVASPSEMTGRIVAVWGKPWVADCAARLRKSCPPDFEADYLRTPTNEWVDGDTYQYSEVFGGDGRALELEFPLSMGPTQFAPTFTAVGQAPQDALYIVARNDPKNPGFGKILTTIALRQYPFGARPGYFLVSDYQRKLANEIFGVSPKWDVNGSKLGEPSTGSSPAYCISGVPRDFFVPLENELTSDSDSFESSWKHYLTLAKQAAAQADQLGEKLVELGLQQDFRREAAGEELGKICGDFSAIDNIEIGNGKVKATSNDSTLNDCLHEPRFELVHLTTRPPSNVDIKQNILHCATNTNPLCEKSEAWLEQNAGVLGITEYYDPDATGEILPLQCDRQLHAVASLGSSFDGKSLNDIATSEDGSAARMASVLKSLQLTVLPDLNWEAQLDGVLVMSTTTAGYWPHCQSQCDALSSPTGKELATRLRDVFGTINVTQAGERDELLQDVTGAMWLMAAMSGELPVNLFTLPIPAANGMASGDSANALTLYGKGQFDLVGSNYQLQLASDDGGKISDKDVQIINKAQGVAINGGFASAAAADTRRPAWQRAIYDDAAHHIHLTASNVARTFPPQPELATWITNQGGLLSGARVDGSGACAFEVSKKTQAIEKHRQLKYPDKSVEKLCSTPDGKSGLLIAQATKSRVDDIFSWGGNRKHSNVMPGYSGQSLGGFSTLLGTHRPNPAFYDSAPTVDPQGCKHTWSTGDFSAGLVKLACLKDVGQLAGGGVPSHTRFTRSALLPSSCTPSERAQTFVNSNNPMLTSCDAARELSQALALSCVLGAGYRSILGGDPLPAMTEPADIAKLETWLLDQSIELRKKLSRLYLTQVPKRVVSDAQSGTVGSGTYKGEHGQLVLQYREHLSALVTGWLEISNELASISGAIRHARIALEGANLQNQLELKKLAMEEVGLHAGLAKTAVDVVDGITFTVNPEAGAQAVKGAIDAQSFATQLVLLKDIKELASGTKANAVSGILSGLSDETGTHYTNIQKALESMRIAVTEAFKTASSLEQKEQEAQYHAAKGLGADFATDSDGKVTSTYPVNTVLRRQYDITQRRYETALRDAQYLAYMARLAIEQRIGMRLEDIDEEVGTLEAPSIWADDVCSFQGIDYKKLRKAATPESNIFETVQSIIWDKYVDPYIGDYTDKLEKFVEFYNIKYPSHEGDDVAVLSIRDDLLGPQGTCFRPSKNLLLFSHDLTRLEAGEEDGSIPPRGWIRTTCDDGDPKCLDVTPGSNLSLSSAPLAPPGIAPREGTTWLYNAAPSDLNVLDGGLEAGVDAGVPSSPNASAPAGSVHQTVELTVGSFGLSWFDRSWGASATDPGPLPASGPDAGAGPPANYFVGVYDSNWNVVAQFTGQPNVPVTGDGGVPNPWSERRVVAFTTSTVGQHHVVFSPTQPGESFGSVVIADVQLEQAASAASVSPYEATDASRLVLTGKCAEGNAEVFRHAFEYGCDAKNCFYELRAPFNVKLGESIAGSALAGKVAQDNYNYRHVNLALNVVGTGVVDCTKKPTPSCFGSPYLEYTLEHVATAAPIINHIGDAHEFNFGIGGVRFAKALAAERFITLPVSSADQALLSQPQFTKVELRGRPLEGTYRLRVYDNPALNWSHVEDIQVVLNYRYWSRIDKASQQK